MKKIGILTSSRADYSIYIPLIKELSKNHLFSVEIIAFGTHLSKAHGYTLDAIINDSLTNYKYVDVGYTSDDSPFGIAYVMGQTAKKFSKFWKTNTYDLIFCLGDRFEMFSAVASALPFQYKIAHLYGGETTLGAIDNSFRHCLTHLSNLHFVSCDRYFKKVFKLTEVKPNIFNFGHLSIDNLHNLRLMNLNELRLHIGVDFNYPTILCTFHPETVEFNRNEEFASILTMVFENNSDYQVLITMPNTDTGGMVIRRQFEKLEKKCNWVFCRENLGTIGYLSAMKHCKLMLGNTSSGFVEASYFPKFVINIGNRQKGRIVTPNIFNVPINKNGILKTIKKIESLSMPSVNKIYGNGQAAMKICNLLKQILIKTNEEF